MMVEYLMCVEDADPTMIISSFSTVRGGAVSVILN